jgi:hypothetical protein
MSLLSSLFQSESMQKTVFGMLKKNMGEGNIRCIVIERDDTGEVTPAMYKDEDRPVIMSQANMDQIKEMLQEQDREINRLNCHINTIEGKLAETMIDLNEYRSGREVPDTTINILDLNTQSNDSHSDNDTGIGQPV